MEQFMPQAKNGLIALALILISGYGDALGFSHSALIWNSGKFAPAELLKSALGYVLGIGAYWISLKFFGELGIVSPELQTLLWFAVTMIGIAVINRTFLGWATSEQVVALLVLAGIGWLIFRTG